MKKVLSLFVFLFITFSFIHPQTDRSNGFDVMPPEFKTVPGTSTFLGPLANAARSYQLLIHESLLTNLVNKEIVGLSWRLPTSATANWPTADVLYTAYDIYLSEGVAPANRSLTFANNVVGVQKLVRSGPLQILTNAYTFGNTPNEFGTEITFNQSFTYTGGHLLVEIRHPGFTGTSRSVDAVSTSTAGYGTNFSALWQSSYTPSTGSQGNFSIVKLRYEDPIPVELTSFTAKVIENKVNLFWSTATELNNQGFEVQRKVKSDFENDWESVAFVQGFGTTAQPKSYSYVDEVEAGTYYYRLKQIDFDGSFNYSNEIEVDIKIVNQFSLEQNFPNPFNPTTKISWQSPVSGLQTLKVYDILGNEIATLVNEFREAGKYNIEFDASNLNSGVYIYKLTSGNFVSSRKMTVVK